MAKQKGIKLIANNKKAFHDYFIEDTYEAGIALAGTEVKSLRMGKCSIKEGFIRVEHGEVFVYGMNISPYEKGNIFNKDPLRVRKLLLHSARTLRKKTREERQRETLRLRIFIKKKGRGVFPALTDKEEENEIFSFIRFTYWKAASFVFSEGRAESCFK